MKKYIVRRPSLPFNYNIYNWDCQGAILQFLKVCENCTAKVQQLLRGFCAIFFDLPQLPQVCHSLCCGKFTWNLQYCNSFVILFYVMFPKFWKQYWFVFMQNSTFATVATTPTETRSVGVASGGGRLRLPPPPLSDSGREDIRRNLCFHAFRFERSFPFYTTPCGTA